MLVEAWKARKKQKVPLENRITMKRIRDPERCEVRECGCTQVQKYKSMECCSERMQLWRVIEIGSITKFG